MIWKAFWNKSIKGTTHLWNIIRFNLPQHEQPWTAHNFIWIHTLFFYSGNVHRWMIHMDGYKMQLHFSVRRGFPLTLQDREIYTLWLSITRICLTLYFIPVGKINDSFILNNLLKQIFAFALFCFLFISVILKIVAKQNTHLHVNGIP